MLKVHYISLFSLRVLKVIKILSKIIISLLIASLVFFLIFSDVFLSKDFISDLYLKFQTVSMENIYLAIFLYLVMYILATSLSIPIATLLTLIGGSIFSWTAIPIILFGATLGATIIFIAASSFLSEFLEKKTNGKFQMIKNGLKKDAFYYLLFIRLVPIAPFAVINIIAGILNIKVSKFMAATFIGIMPATSIYVWIGKSAGEILSRGSIPDISNIFWSFLPPLLLLAIMSLIPIIWRIWQKNN